MKEIKRYARTIFCVSTVVLFSACAKQTIFRNIPILEDVEIFFAEQIHSAANENDHHAKKIDEPILIKNKSSPESGDIVTIHEHDSEKTYDVTVEKIFHAASNRRCLYFHEPNQPKRKEPTGLACLNDVYLWIRIPAKILK